MAVLNATYQYNIDDLRLKFYMNRFQSHFLEQDVNNPWEDNYTIFGSRDAIELLGSGFGYNGNHEMVKGQVEGFSEWFWDTDELAWTEIFNLSNARKVSSADFWDALQTATTRDDYKLMEKMFAGNDRFNLSDDSDTAKGYDGKDLMFGNGGRDILKGMDGNDKLYGGNGKDRLFAGDGNDVLRGGNGHDKLVGGNGADTFRFVKGDDKEVIIDFETGVDTIDVSKLVSVRHWRDLTNNHMEQHGDDVWIDAYNGDLIIIKDTEVGDLSKGDFLF